MEEIHLSLKQFLEDQEEVVFAFQKLEQDQIIQSSKEKKDRAIDATAPQLMIPELSFDRYIEHLALKKGEKLEQFLEQLKKEERLKKVNRQDFLEFKREKKSDKKEQESFVANMVSFYLDQKDLKEEEELSLVIGMFVISTSFIGPISSASSKIDGGNIAFNIVSHQFSGFDLKQKSQKELELIASYYLTMLSYQTALLSPYFMKKKSDRKLKAFAREFLAFVIQRVQKKEFILFLKKRVDDKQALYLTLFLVTCALVLYAQVFNKSLKALVKQEKDHLFNKGYKLITKKTQKDPSIKQWIEELIQRLEKQPKELVELLQPSRFLMEILQQKELLRIDQLSI